MLTQNRQMLELSPSSVLWRTLNR